jgi:hypothetical protein
MDDRPRTYGTCRVCRRRYQLRPDDLMRSHIRPRGTDGFLCPGAGDFSAEQVTALEAAGVPCQPPRTELGTRVYRLL